MSLLFRTPARFLLIGAGALWTSPILAQDAGLPAPQPVIPYELSVASAGVSERQREEYASKGLRAFGGALRPSVQIAGGYTDNVFGTGTDEVDDAYMAARPGFEFRLGEGDRFFSLNGAVELRRYLDYDRASETGLLVDADASVPVGQGALLQSGVLARRAYERPSSGSFPLEALGRIEFDEVASYVRFIRGGSRVRVLAALDATRFDFKDALPAFGGTAIDQNDRDRSVYRGSARLEWSVSGDLSTFVEGAYSRLDYRRQLRLDGIDNADGSRWEAKAGVLLKSGKLRGGLGLGYSRRQFDSPSYTDISGSTIDASLQYLASGLTTVSLAARRSIEEAGAADAGSFVQTHVTARIDHELLRNLILGVNGQYARSGYRQIDRNDKIVSIAGTGRYLISPHAEINLEIGWTDRKSSGQSPGPEFDALYGSCGVTFRF